MRRAGNSPRGVLPRVVCLSVVTKPRLCEGPSPVGAVPPLYIYIYIYITQCKVQIMKLVIV
jgi:hypothetical protein